MQKKFFLFFFPLLLVPGIIFADDRPDVGAQVREQLQTTGESAEVNRDRTTVTDPRHAAAALVQILLSILGTVFLILLLMSGYWLLTARGQEEKVEKAQKTIRGAVIGLIIIMAAYAVTIFVTSRLGDVVGAFLSPSIAYAVDDTELGQQMNAFAGEQGANLGAPTDPRLVVASIIRVFLTVIGTLFVAYTVYAGYMIMTSGGQEEKIKKGKDTLRNSIIGIVVTLSAYAITLFVTGKLQQATLEQPGFDAGVEIQGTPRPPSRDPYGATNPYTNPF